MYSPPLPVIVPTVTVTGATKRPELATKWLPLVPATVVTVNSLPTTSTKLLLVSVRLPKSSKAISS